MQNNSIWLEWWIVAEEHASNCSAKTIFLCPYPVTPIAPPLLIHLAAEI